ncbi:uncharacterized protein LOC126470739 [Schistocerca serialis cubense]|uniref:uncharacterized protein LOC126470739 n=1 Tax=Schistocerca serialis cubense TaxID=2023355 RepID=UPI00214E4047|nr:uncharacterized protein LOC126470739 [Schistocerca serialis cubense]
MTSFTTWSTNQISTVYERPEQQRTQTSWNWNKCQAYGPCSNIYHLLLLGDPHGPPIGYNVMTQNRFEKLKNCLKEVPEEHNGVDEVMIRAAGKNVKRKRESWKGLAREVVMKSTDTLPENHNFKVYADNLFTSDILAQYLLNRGIYLIGTVRANKLKGFDLPKEKDMKAKGRGAVASLDHTGRFIVVRRYDSKSLTLLSSFAGVELQDKANRWNK